MTEYCTIFGQEASYEASAVAVRRVVGAPRCNIVGAESRWLKIVVSGRGGTLTLTAVERERPGDRFSKMILGLHNTFRQVITEDPKKDGVLAAISTVKVAIGVVVESGILPDEDLEACILGVARATRGVVFDGGSLLDGHGSLILGPEGRVGPGTLP
ncbi:MAG: hypothetical protein ACE5FA_09090 [Dehalococcoidia bacterium]